MSLVKSVAWRLGLPRGAWSRAVSSARPSQPLVLFGFEGCPSCRRVRQSLSELGLDYLHRSCPYGEGPNRAELLARGGKAQVPYLVDPNRGIELHESSEIVAYLERHYAA